MNYIDSTLMKNEVVLYRTKPHWIIFAPAVIWFIVCIILFIYEPKIVPVSFRTTSVPVYLAIAYIALLLAIFFAVSSYVNYQTSEYGITNKRVLVKIGFIRRISLEIFHNKIEAIRVYQSVLGRLLNYGSIIIVGVGGSQDPFAYIPDPLGFRKKVQEQIDTINESVEK